MNDAKASPLARLVAAHPGIWAKDATAISFLPSGWYEIVHGLLLRIENEVGNDIAKFRIEQIKEKYAGLRVYYSIHGRTRLNVDLGMPGQRVRMRERSAGKLSERIDGLIDEAEAECARSCQICGASARRRDDGGWLATLCDPHAKERRASEDVDSE